MSQEKNERASRNDINTKYNMNESQTNIQIISTEWIAQGMRQCTYAATLTLKPYRNVMTEKGQIMQSLGVFEAQENFRHFLSRLNFNIFGNSAKRYNKRLIVIPALEGQVAPKLLHYHCGLGGFPAWLTEEQIRKEVILAWDKTAFGNQQVDVQSISNADGWLAYITKEAKNILEAIDINNLHLPPPATLLT